MVSTPILKKFRLVFGLDFGYHFSMGIVATDSLRLGKRDKFAPSSRFISEVDYDPVGCTLDLTFKSGSKYRYLNVYASTYLSFKSSPTFDAYYARAIKGNLQSVKLIDAGIGREKSTPLDKVKKERTLDAGLKRQESRNRREYENRGTVDRAFNAANR